MDRERADRLIRACFGRALLAVDPAAAVRRATHDLPGLLDGPPPVVLAIGKAAGAMTAGLVAALPASVARGVVITKDRRTVGELPPTLEIFEAGHPIPDERTIQATRAALSMLEGASPDEPVVVLISGGGSSLFEAPVDGITLDDLADLTRRMLRAGATINELNAVRGRLSRVKQGGLLDYIADEHPVTLVLSDVIGNDLAVIASGPTVPRDDSILDARSTLEGLGVWPAIAPAVRGRLESPDAPTSHASRAGTHRIIADNDTAIDAFRAAVEVDHAVEVAWRQRVGEARDLAVAWVAACRHAGEGVEVLLGGGEATVTVSGDGVGGRNTEFAVAAAIELDRWEMDGWMVASLATDGDDGPTGATGGIASRRTVTDARQAGVDPVAALAANDSLRVLGATGGVVATGATGTNVNDLYVAVRVR